mgnify:CR=1 FL=1
MLFNENEINISSMSLEELEKARDEVRTLLSELNHSISLRKIAQRKYCSNSSEK